MGQPAAASRDSPQRTRLLMVNSTLHIGGAEQVAACLAERVSAERFELSACYLKEPGLIAEQMLRAGVDLVPVRGLQVGRRDYLTSLKLRRLIGERNIQVIHTHDVHGLMDGAVCRMTVRRLRHVHTFHYGNYPHRRPALRAIEGSLWRIPDALIAVGHEQAATIRKFYKIPEDRLRVIWNGVDDPGHQGDESLLKDVAEPGTPIIASISTLIQQKGLNHLLEAAALLRRSGERFRLVIAGDGGLKDALHEQSRSLGLSEHVRFLGWVPQASRRILPECDIFVQSSLWEAMSVVVLEAMAAGRPMVVTTVGENPHVVVDGKTGLIVPPGSPAALADALRALLHDPQLRNALGRNARSRYEQLFTTQHMISAHERLYQALVDANAATAAAVTAA